MATTKKTVKKQPVKKKVATKKVPTKKTETPMTFHDDPKKNITWYAVVIVLVAAFVLANILPNTTFNIGKGEPLEPKPVVSRTSITIPTKVDIVGGGENIKVNTEELSTNINSVEQLESLLKKNVASVENALTLISKRETRTIEQLDAIAKTALGLNTRLSQLQEELNTLRKQNEEKAKIQDPSRIFLGQIMVFLTDSYHRGNVTHKQLNNLRQFSETVAQNDIMVEKVDNLISLTPDEGPVTLTELSLLAGKLMNAGAPEVEDLTLTEEGEEGYVADAKRFLSDWVEVKKLSIEGDNHPWVKALDAVQKELSRGNVKKVQELLKTDKAFERDIRVDSLKEKVSLYASQQQALSDVMNAYSENYVMSQ